MAFKKITQRRELFARLISFRIFFHAWLLSAVWLTHDVCVATIDEWQDTLEVTVSRGAQITEIPDVVLFSEMEYILFSLPDVPDPPAFTVPACKEFMTDEACQVFLNMQQGVRDVADIMSVVNRILTSRGLKDVKDFTQVILPKSLVNVVKGVDVSSYGPSDDMRNAAGSDWVSETEARLALRKILINDNEFDPRVRRWIKVVLKPIAKVVKALASGGNIDIFKYLFTGDNSILTFLTNNKALTKKEYKVFTDLPKRVSEFQDETRLLLRDVLNSTETVKRLTNHLEDEIRMHTSKTATIQDAFLLEQHTLADVIRYLYITNVYMMHFAAFESCKSEKLSPIFVPATLLEARLQKVKAEMPSNLEFSIPIQDIQRYYKLHLADCIFDSNGGLVRLAIPLTRRPSNFVLYQFKVLHFAHEGETCSLETPSGFVIKDLLLNKVYTVAEVDLETCKPQTTGLCRIPMETMDDSFNFCTSVLLTGQTAEDVRESCKLRCFQNSLPAISQISSNVFIGNHLRPHTAEIVCPDKTIQLKEVVPYGAVRFLIGCQCRLEMMNATLGYGSSQICESSTSSSISVMLPVQFTHLKDFLPFLQNGDSDTVFSHAKEIFDNTVILAEKQATESTMTPTPYQTASYMWNSIHTFLIAFIFFKLKALTRSVITALGTVQAVDAGNIHTCKLPVDAYFMLIAILLVCMLSFLPKLLFLLYKRITRTYNHEVHLEARRMVAEEINDRAQMNADRDAV